MNCDTITRPCELQLVCARCATVVCGGRGAAGHYNRHGDGHDHFADRAGRRLTWDKYNGLVNSTVQRGLPT
jgi:hypothetical protein